MKYQGSHCEASEARCNGIEDEQRSRSNFAVSKMEQSEVCEDGCDGCFYWREMYDDLYACHYLLHTGKRRPCEPGKKCTVKQFGIRNA